MNMMISIQMFWEGLTTGELNQYGDRRCSAVVASIKCTRCVVHVLCVNAMCVVHVLCVTAMCVVHVLCVNAMCVVHVCVSTLCV